MIRRDRNHPSIVVWGMLSESGNAGRRPGKGVQTIKDALCARVRELDPTRLIIDDFGGAPITREPARFMPPFSTELQPFDDAEIPREGPALGGGDAIARSCGAPGKLAFPAAQGFGGLEDLDGVVRQYGGDVDGLKDGRALKALRDALTAEFNERGLDRTFGSLRYLAESAQALAREAAERRIDALRGNPRLHGYCLGQLSGAGLDVCAGLLDRWRRPKPALEGVKAAQAPIRLALDLPRVNLAPREEAYVQVTSINETGSEDRYDLSLQVVGPTNQVLWKKKRSVKLAKGARALWDGAIAASGSLGPHRFVVRLMQGIKIVVEASVTFYVYERPEAAQHEVHVVDPLGQYRGRCQGFAKVTKSDAAVFVVPPLANTIRAYPDEAMGQVLSQVEDGAVALVFGPPGDWNDLAAGIAPDQLNATSRAVGGPFSGAYHYVRLHPVFETLPSRCLMGASYASVAPVKTFIEPSDEDIAGALDLSQPDGERWGQDILVRPFGSGHVVFTHLRVLENLETDPLAQRLFVNLINHFGRLAVPAGGALPTVTQVRNWIRQTRAHELRRWMVVGLFPNANGEGHESVYPPEESIDFGAEYDGWRKSIRWRSWFSRTQDGHAVDLSQVFTPATDDYPWTETGAAYAYAEFQADRRVQAKIELAATDSVKLWLNGHPLIDEDFHAPMGQMEKHTADAMLRQGRNTVLVKLSKLPGESRFTLDIAAAGRDPLNVIWWR